MKLKLRPDKVGIVVHAFMECHVTTFTSISMTKLCNNKGLLKINFIVMHSNTFNVNAALILFTHFVAESI